MASPKAQALTLAASLGAEWDESDSGPGELRGTMDAPPGQKWTATTTHGIAICFYSDRPAGWRSLTEDMRAGLYPCDEGDDCEVCG